MVKADESFVKGSAILIVSFGVFNIFNFLFHFLMARSLSVSDYGILLSLFSIIYFLSVFSESIQTIIAKYTSNEKNLGKIKNIAKRAVRRAIVISLVVFLIYAILGIALAKYMRIDYLLILTNGLIIFAGFLLPINRGVMQGRKKFFSLGENMIFESAAKILLAVVFIFIGFGLYGAIGGVVLASLSAFFISFYPLKNILKSKEEKAKTQGIYSYSWPAFTVSAAVLFFYSIDVVIARIVFPEQISGSYAIASILAKSIFFASVPITKAMFPIAAENENNNKNILKKSVILVSFVSVCALFLFYFFPEVIIKIFSGKEIAESASILFYLGIGTFILSLSNLILLFKLSRKRIKNFKWLPLTALVEVLLLFYFSTSLFAFAMGFVLASLLFLGMAIALN